MGGRPASGGGEREWREEKGDGSEEQWQEGALREKERSGVGPSMHRKNWRSWTFNFIQTVRLTGEVTDDWQFCELSRMKWLLLSTASEISGYGEGSGIAHISCGSGGCHPVG